MDSNGDNSQNQENPDQVKTMESQENMNRRNSSISLKPQPPTSPEEETTIDGLNWRALREEFTLKKVWTLRSWKDIGKNFIMVLLLGLIPSGYDVISDGFLVRDFVGGTNYTRLVTTNFTEPPGENCSHIKNIYDLSHNGSEILAGQAFTCFEEDPIWGYVTLIFLLWSGLWGGPQVWEGLNGCTKTALVLLAWPFFAFILIGAKVVALFNPGDHWKRFCFRLTSAEGRWEARLQFQLQLFIVFSRPDRVPSTLQMASLAISLIMIVKTDIAAFLQDQPGLNMKEQLEKSMALLPLFLTSTINGIGTIVVAMALLKYWYVFFPICFAIMTFCIQCKKKTNYLGLLNPTRTSLNTIISTTKNSRNYITYNLYQVAYNNLVLTCLVIAANCAPDAFIYNMFEPSKGHKFSDTTIVKNLHVLNSIYLVVLISGTINLFLTYVQIVEPTNEAEVQAKKEDVKDEAEVQAINSSIALMGI